jgi:hypothetical protein
MYSIPDTREKIERNCGVDAETMMEKEGEDGRYRRCGK